jgi:hypothetical protein
MEAGADILCLQVGQHCHRTAVIIMCDCVTIIVYSACASMYNIMSSPTKCCSVIFALAGHILCYMHATTCTAHGGASISITMIIVLIYISCINALCVA